MWFGTRQHMTEIPDPAPGVDMGTEGWSASSKTLGGGARTRGSIAAARSYAFEWPVRDWDKVRRIFDYADGVYDTDPGVNYLYFVSPDAMRYNVMSQRWAQPSSAAFDAMPLLRSKRPTAAPTPVNSLGYPAQSAFYRVESGDTPEVAYIPINPGMELHIGAHGSSTGATGIRVTPYNGLTAGAAVDLTLLSVTDPTRVNASFSSNDFTGVEVQIIVGTGDLILSGVIAQILPIGETPIPGNWIGGLGHEGCTFDGKPRRNVYNVDQSRSVVNTVVTARLIETFPWR